jgi:hypothetical protein
MAFAILFAGIAQAAHYHEDQLVHAGSTDVHCLLCLFAGGSAAPPVILPIVPPAVPRHCDYRPADSSPCPESTDPASYDARGPPRV